MVALPLERLQERIPESGAGLTVERMIDIRNRVAAVSVWLNRDGCKNDADIAPDHTIISLRELEEILESSRGRR